MAYETEGAQIKSILRFLKERTKLKRNAVVVIGASTSEIAGGRIGKNSVPELGEAVAEAIIAACAELELCPAFQCCEHLNRALVMERPLLERLRLTEVNVMPIPKAGGSVAAGAWKHMSDPVAALSIQADAAIDIGDTLVGMHLRPVAVPLRADNGEDRVGEAHVVMAYSRLPYIGGSRAVYRN